MVTGFLECVLSPLECFGYLLVSCSNWGKFFPTGQIIMHRVFCFFKAPGKFDVGIYCHIGILWVFIAILAYYEYSGGNCSSRSKCVTKQWNSSFRTSCTMHGVDFKVLYRLNIFTFISSMRLEWIGDSVNYLYPKDWIGRAKDISPCLVALYGQWCITPGSGYCWVFRCLCSNPLQLLILI